MDETEILKLKNAREVARARAAAAYATVSEAADSYADAALAFSVAENKLKAATVALDTTAKGDA